MYLFQSGVLPLLLQHLQPPLAIDVGDPNLPDPAALLIEAALAALCALAKLG
jgi:hypothetical protein